MYVGKGVRKNQLDTGNYPAVKCGDINSKLNPWFKECISFIDDNLIQQPKYFEYGDILVSVVGHNKKAAGTATAYLGQGKGIAGEGLYVVKHKQNPQFLAYMMSSKFCRKQIEQKSCGGSVVNFFMKDLKKIKVPLPPLEIQKQIASTLEKLDQQMNALTNHIQTLSMSREQQGHYWTNKTIK